MESTTATCTRTANPVATHNGLLTVRSESTGEHRTFKIRTQRPGDWAEGERVLSVLTGSNNESDYTRIGFVKVRRLRGTGADSGFERFEVRVVLWKKYRGGQFARLARMIEKLGRHIDAGRVSINFDSRCIVCNRTLTTPESVASGIGPTCKENQM